MTDGTDGTDDRTEGTSTTTTAGTDGDAAIGALDVRATFAGATSHRGVVYASLRGFRPLLLDVHVPTAAPGPVPCVVWVHGGGWEQGDRRFPPADWPLDLLFGDLLAAGLAVATVDYRLSAEAHHPAPLHDVKAAVRFVRSRAAVLGIDPDRIGVAGESAGGHLAAMVALTAGVAELRGDVGSELADPTTSDAVAAAAILYGVTDFAAQLGEDLPPEQLLDSPEVRLLGATPEQAPAIAAAASPVHHASADAPPLLLISGDADTVVDLDQSVRLRDALVAAGARDVVLEVVPGADHCFDGVDPAGPVATVTRFLADRLGASPPAR
jgi:acetyl esterase/lipase